MCEVDKQVVEFFLVVSKRKWHEIAVCAPDNNNNNTTSTRTKLEKTNGRKKRRKDEVCVAMDALRKIECSNNVQDDRRLMLMCLQSRMSSTTSDGFRLRTLYYKRQTRAGVHNIKSTQTQPHTRMGE